MSLRCAVIGNPIGHSLSPLIHHAFAQQFSLPLLYEKIQGHDVDFEQQVSDFFVANGKGLNVTLPFKQRAYRMADRCSERCIKAGAANTLWYENNKLVADNTDGIGLLCDLSRYISLDNTRILILGAGGAARGIIHPLLEAQPQKLIVANRSMEPLKKLQAEIAEIHCVSLAHLEGEFDLIINATSAGTYGEGLVLPSVLLKNRPFCYDLAYSYKAHTPFVDYAQQQDCTAVDGLGMLVEQAAESFYLWHGIKPDTESVIPSLK